MKNLEWKIFNLIPLAGLSAGYTYVCKINSVKNILARYVKKKYTDRSSEDLPQEFIDKFESECQHYAEKHKKSLIKAEVCFTQL